MGAAWRGWSQLSHVSLQPGGLWQVPREGEHVPVSSSAVPPAPGWGYGLHGSGEGSWDEHPATLKQSEQKRWDETGTLVHGMKLLSPAGNAGTGTAAARKPSPLGTCTPNYPWGRTSSPRPGESPSTSPREHEWEGRRYLCR